MTAGKGLKTGGMPAYAHQRAFQKAHTHVPVLGRCSAAVQTGCFLRCSPAAAGGHNRRAVSTSSTANRKVSSHQVDNDNGMHARGSHGHPQANTESQQSPERIGLGAEGDCTPRHYLHTRLYLHTQALWQTHAHEHTWPNCCCKGLTCCGCPPPPPKRLEPAGEKGVAMPCCCCCCCCCCCAAPLVLGGDEFPPISRHAEWEKEHQMQRARALESVGLYVHLCQHHLG